MRSFFKGITILSVFSSLLWADVIINDKYKDEILNQELHTLRGEIVSVSDFSNALNHEYGYRIHSYLKDLSMEKKILMPSDNRVGTLFSEFLREYPYSIDVDNKNATISIRPLQSFFIQLPHNWDMYSLREKFAFARPEIEFKVVANRLYAFGTEKQLALVTPIMRNVEYGANKKLRASFVVYNYNTKEQSDEFIGYRKEDNLKDEPLQKFSLSAEHGEKLGFNYGNHHINVEFDLVNHQVCFQKEHCLDIGKTGEQGFVFKKGLSHYILVMRKLEI